ncbi:MAG: TonB family protein [Gemmatimonadota bacterium]|nr:MAG: TonB family protein [Gemmatimonadota bacterium]
MKLYAFSFIIMFTVMMSPKWASPLKPTDRQEDPDTTTSTVMSQDTTVREMDSVDTSDTGQEEPDTASIFKVPPDTAKIPPAVPDSAEIGREAPAISRIGRSVRDATPAAESPDDTSGADAISADTSTVEAAAPDTSLDITAEPDTAGLVRPDTVSLETEVGPDTTAFVEALIDTIFGRLDTAYVGEILFSHKRTLPFSALYTYRYAGLQSDTTFGIELITNIMQRSYRSQFQYFSKGTNIVAIGPYDVEIFSAESLQLVFEPKGFVKLPEPEIPEPVEEIVEAETPSAVEPTQLKASPTDPKEYFSRAYIRASEGNYGEAKRDLGKILEMDSTFFEARLMLGWILSEENDSGAVEVFRKCAALKPDDRTASSFLAYNLKRFGSSEEAFDSYTEIVAEDSSNSGALFHLAALYEAKGDSQKADPLFEKARSMTPGIDTTAATPSLADIHHEYWWVEEGLQLLHFEEPVSPGSAVEESLECDVNVSILVDETGKPAEVTIDEPCVHAGSNEAIESAAWKCTFRPGQHKGKPVRVWVSLPFRVEPAEAVVVADSTKTTETDTSALVAEVPTDVDVTQAPLDTGEVRPKLVGFIKPHYPPQALEDSIETTVVLSVLVGTDGSVTEVKFVRPDTLNEAFNEEAEKAARRCRFQPGLRDGSPDTMWTELPMTFSLTSPPTTPEGSIPRPQRRPPAREEKPPQAGSQDKAAALVEATMLAAQQNYDEALQKLTTILKSDAKEKNAQLLYGLIILAKEVGKRVEDVAPLAHGTEADSYWWVDTMPEIKEFKEAAYPEAVIASGAEARVVLYALVSENGSVEKVILLTPAEEQSFNAAAEEAAKGSTFTPGTLDGEPVRVWSRLSYEFTPSE